MRSEARVPRVREAPRSSRVFTLSTLSTLGTVALLPATLWAQGTIVGVVLARESGERLAHTVVAVPSLEINRFANDSGIFVLRDLPPGSFVAHVRRLGYAPQDLMLTVRTGAHDTLRIELTRVAMKLTPVQVRADPPCHRPGLRAVTDSALLTLLTQLRMNGDQYRLLSERYPFFYSQERIVTSELKGGETRIDRIDTIFVASKPLWRYRPGRILTRPTGPRGELLFNIPTLLDFADALFVDNHCFADGGLDHVDGTDLIRIDLYAWAQIKNPDVNGSIYLDPETFQIRRSVLRLSRHPKVKGLIDVEVTTIFQEVLASIPVVSQVFGVQRYDPSDKKRDVVAGYEHHRLVAVRFVRSRPGEDQ